MSNAEILPAPEIEAPACWQPSKWERERSAFRRLCPSLLSTHRGQFVAIHDEQVVGSGTDQLSVAREAYRRFGYVPIYVGLVTDQAPPVARVPSPRIVR